jgi:diguanylate cyclase (GGDEF)-like protein/PAS domain S-box-containing protein
MRVTPRGSASSAPEMSRHLLESAPDAIVGIGRQGRIVFANSQAARLFGYASDDLIGAPVERLVPERFRSTHVGHRDGYFADPRFRAMGAGLELFGRRRDGSEFPAEISLSSIETAEGVFATAAIRDVSERKQVEYALREAEERFRGTFESSGIGMAVVAVTGAHPGRFLEINDALCVVSGYEREQLVHMNSRSLVHPDDRQAARDGVDGLLRGELKTFHHEFRLLHASGDPIWVDATTSLVRDANGEPLYRIDQLRDVSDRKRHEGELRQLADHDALTGLFNRRRFREELDRELAVAHRYETGGALLALDLDHFKFVNDSLGHAVGDELISRVAAAFRERLRSTDIIARLGGDEFGVILPHTDEQQARAVADDLLAAVRDELPAFEQRVTVSIGIAHFQNTGGMTGEELLVEADIAMYDAKDAGRDLIATYDAAEHRQTRMQTLLTWTDRIRHALSSDSFVLHAQPILGLKDDARPRYELLLRLIGDDGELIMPGAFLHVGERFGLAQEIDRWVVHRAIDLLADWQRACSNVCLEINLSAHSVGDTRLTELMTERLAATNADPRGLCFELTETAAIVNVDRARDFARWLAELGCEFALDDFGAGFASFYYLKHLHFDYVKIDGEFITDLQSSRADQLVVRSIVQIAKGLGKRTIAEFVGDQETLDLLREEGVDFAQGYFIGRPGPIEGVAVENTSVRISPIP